MLTTPTAFVFGTQLYFVRDGDTIATTTVSTTKRARASNVATITTAKPHGFAVGQVVTTALLPAAYNGASQTITSVIDPYKFTYANTGTDETETADTAGTVAMATGTVSSVLRPGSENTIWSSLGAIESFSLTLASTELEVYGANPGHVELVDKFYIKAKADFGFTTQQVTPRILEMALRLPSQAALTTGATAVLTGTVFKGWLKAAIYDDSDTFRMLQIHRATFTPDGDINFSGEEVFKPKFKGAFTQSSLNTFVYA